MKTQIISISKHFIFIFVLLFATSCSDHRPSKPINNGVNFKSFKAATSKLNNLNALSKIFNKSTFSNRLADGEQIVVTAEMLQEFQSSTGIVLNVSLENINAVRL